jgi:ABC-type phosphate transport system substrate-binding protein
MKHSLRTASLVALVALQLLGAAAPPHRETVTFVVSPRSPLRDLSSAELRRIFLGETSRWNDHRRIVLLLRPMTSPESRLLLDRVVTMSAIDYSQHWIGAVFRGEAASIPRVADSREALLKAVADDPRAIGFVLSTAEPLAPAAAITIDGKTPDDPRYPVGR